MLLVVGLGNPGREYAAHRHNVGFMAVEALADATRAPAFRSKFSALITRARLDALDAVLLMPQTYMNCSGDSVQPCAAFYRVAPADLVVVHDDLDLPFGTVRLKRDGGHGGHNGLRSVIGRLGSADFGRLRMGIGRPPADFRGDVSAYVLSSFSPDERAGLDEFVARAAKTVLDIAARGFDAAMKTRNTRPKKKRQPVADAGEAGQAVTPTARPDAADPPAETAPPSKADV